MAEYHLLTIWCIEAPLTAVYAVIENTLDWPQWWSSVRKVEQKVVGAVNGIGNVRSYVWQGDLPYGIVFDVRATRIEELVAIEGIAEGDLSGLGRWTFSQRGEISIVQYEWHVTTMRWWMNFATPLTRSIFIRNHVQIMELGGNAIARRLNTRLVMQKHTDLLDV